MAASEAALLAIEAPTCSAVCPRRVPPALHQDDPDAVPAADPSVGVVARSAGNDPRVRRDLVGWASQLAHDELDGPLPRRWAHSQGVAARAALLASVVAEDSGLLGAAAVLHDIGYAPRLVVTGFHPLDGARFLRWPAPSRTTAPGSSSSTTCARSDTPPTTPNCSSPTTPRTAACASSSGPPTSRSRSSWTRTSRRTAPPSPVPL